MADIIQFPREKIRQPGTLSPLQLKAAQFIRLYAMANGGTWPSMERLGHHIGVRSIAGTKRIVAQLLDAKAISLPGPPDSPGAA